MLFALGLTDRLAGYTTTNPVSAQMVTYAPDVRAVIPIADLRTAFPTVQTFPAGALNTLSVRLRVLQVAADIPDVDLAIV